jgi:hypothetical protein
MHLDLRDNHHLPSSKYKVLYFGCVHLYYTEGRVWALPDDKFAIYLFFKGGQKLCANPLIKKRIVQLITRKTGRKDRYNDTTNSHKHQQHLQHKRLLPSQATPTTIHFTDKIHPSTN